MQEKYEIPKSCAQCRHFHQHYVRVAGYRYAPLDEGHCSEPRCRDKRADTPPAPGSPSGRSPAGERKENPRLDCMPAGDFAVLGLLRRAGPARR